MQCTWSSLVVCMSRECVSAFARWLRCVHVRSQWMWSCKLLWQEIGPNCGTQTNTFINQIVLGRQFKQHYIQGFGSCYILRLLVCLLWPEIGPTCGTQINTFISQIGLSRQFKQTLHTRCWILLQSASACLSSICGFVVCMRDPSACDLVNYFGLRSGPVAEHKSTHL